MAPRVERRLAAILAADVVGYSRLVGADEAGTIARLKALRKEFIEPLIAEYRGRVVKLMGDGALVEFGSAVDAVECAVALQSGVAERETAVPEERRIGFRIGINVGDIIVEDGDILGDGVNVATRLEGLAEPGGICVARNVHNQVRTKLALAFAPMGRHRVKNIAEPVEVWRVVLDEAAPKPRATARRLPPAALAAGVVALLALGSAGAWWWQQDGAAVQSAATDAVLARPNGPTIAVLPFENMSGDPEQNYFADGITEDIITRLARFSELSVIARNSSFQYKGRNVDLRRVGEELGAQYVLEGSVRRSENSIRLTAQLIDARDGTHLWANSFDRQLNAKEIFGIQDEITASVVGSIGGVHGAISRANATASQQRPEHLASYDCLLLAYVYDRQQSPENFARARSCLSDVLKREPNYADAHAAFAYLNADGYGMGWGLADTERERLLQAALLSGQRAVELRPDSARNHWSLAYAKFVGGDLPGFYAHAERALALNPNDPDVLGYAGVLMAFSGAYDRGLELLQRAIALNPHHPEWWQFGVVTAHLMNDRHEEALSAILKVNQPDNFWMHIWRAVVFDFTGDQGRAKAAIAQLLDVYPGFSPAQFRVECGYWHCPEELVDKSLGALRRAGLPDASDRSEG